MPSAHVISSLHHLVPLQRPWEADWYQGYGTRLRVGVQARFWRALRGS